MFDLFGAPWEKLDRSLVEKFLAEAGEEGVTWEAKGQGGDGGRLRPDTLRKAACGLANQIGGYIIVGASGDASGWRLEGIQRPTEEPAVWMGQILRRLQPVPRFEVSEPFELDDDRIAFVVRVEPIAEPPCMTPQGRVYERVSGETVPVQDPALLDRLLRRGEQARARAESFARRAAERAIALPDWPEQRSVSVAIGLASIARETDDISSRLFTASTHQALVDSIWKLFGDQQPERFDFGPSQATYTAIMDSPEASAWESSGTKTGVIRFSRFIQANWDGSVGAGAWFSDAPLRQAIHPDLLIRQCWEEAAGIVARLGGYGPAHLHVLVQIPAGHGSRGHIIGRKPPEDSLYAKLPTDTEMARTLDRLDCDEDVVSSLRRELQRAGGIRTDEAE